MYPQRLVFECHKRITGYSCYPYRWAVPAASCQRWSIFESLRHCLHYRLVFRHWLTIFVLCGQILQHLQNGLVKKVGQKPDSMPTALASGHQKTLSKSRFLHSTEQFHEQRCFTPSHEDTRLDSWKCYVTCIFPFVVYYISSLSSLQRKARALAIWSVLYLSTNERHNDVSKILPQYWSDCRIVFNL